MQLSEKTDQVEAKVIVVGGGGIGHFKSGRKNGGVTTPRLQTNNKKACSKPQAKRKKKGKNEE